MHMNAGSSRVKNAKVAASLWGAATQSRLGPSAFSAANSRLLLSGEALSLVDHAGRDPLEGLGIGSCVVGAEEELAAHFKFELHVGLRAAPITAIVRGQSAFFKHRFHALHCGPYARAMRAAPAPVRSQRNQLWHA